MIEVHNLTKHYGPVTAIRDVSFTVAPGEIVGFLGPNGAGKSTTMRILSCFMPATDGSARVAGYDVMERCRITDMQHRLIGKLSKGYRQRVGLAQAIVNDPSVLILDEPTIGLDPRQITEIRSLIKSLAGAHTVILSTHILPEVAMVCSGVIIINKGSVVAQGPIDSLVEQFFPVSRVHVEVIGPPAAVRDGMRKIPGVVSVRDETLGDGHGAYVVESARGRDVRAEIFLLAAQQRWELRELRRVGMTLEEVFIRVVAGEEAEEGE